MKEIFRKIFRKIFKKRKVEVYSTEIFVSKDGNDLNSGKNRAESKRTLKAAYVLAAELLQTGSNLIAITSLEQVKRVALPKKIHQGNEIYAACKKMEATFTANDIKEELMQSDSEKMRNLSAGHISARLCKLAQDQKILLVRKGRGRGRPNEYNWAHGF